MVLKDIIREMKQMNRNRAIRYHIVTAVLLMAVLLLFGLGAAMASSSGTCGNQLTWELNDDGKLTISGVGPMDEAGEIPWKSHTAGIRSVVVENGVTGIAPFAFANCEKLESVSLPRTVLKIGNGAFSVCPALKDITLPPYLDEVAGGLFRNCVSLQTVSIPSGVRTLQTNAFLGCSSLSALTLPAGLEKIGDNVFEGSGLKALTVPSRVRTIGKEAFRQCAQLVKVELPYGLEKIGYQAFMECTALEEINLPDSITSLGLAAFYGCTALKEIKLPAGIRSVEKDMFWYCISLSRVTIPAGIVEIGSHAFGKTVALQEISIPGTVKTIESYAFGESGLKKVTIPSGVLTLEERAFCAELNLKEVRIENGLKEISENCFNGPGVPLTDIYIPESVEYIAWDALPDSYDVTVHCTAASYAASWAKKKGYQTVITESDLKPDPTNPSVTPTPPPYHPDPVPSPDPTQKPDAVSGACGHFYWDLDPDGVLTVRKENTDSKLNQPWNAYADRIYEAVLEPGVPYIDIKAFSDCVMLRSVSIPDSVSYIGQSAFSNCLSLETVQLSASSTMKRIEANAFYKCEKLKSFELPQTLTKIGEMAFYGCKALEEMTIPDTVTFGQFNTAVFSNCSALKKIRFPANCKLIPGSFLAGCTALTALEVPDTVEEIGSYAFNACTGLTSFVIPDTVKTIGSGLFMDCTGLKELTLPSGLTEIPAWLAGRCENLEGIMIPAGVTLIGDNAFYSCVNLKSIVFPAPLAAVGVNAFYGCKSLETLELPDGFRTIGNSAFSQCINLKTAVIPATVTEIGSQAFYDCRRMTGDIGLPDGLVTLGEGAFEGCLRLKEIHIPSGLATIPGEVCIDCSGFKKLNIPEGIRQIEAHAFDGCVWLHEVRLPASLGSIAENAFGQRSLAVFVCPEGSYAASWVTSKGFRLVTDGPDAVVIAEPTAREGLIANGSAQELITAGEAVNGEMNYALGPDAETVPSAGWSPGIPAGTEAGTYFVWYKVIGDESHADTGPEVIRVAIAPEPGSEPEQPDQPDNPDQPEPEPEPAPEPEPQTPEEKVAAFVKRCYKLILNRDADEGGLKGWSDALTSKTATAAQIIDGFVRSQEFTNRNLGNDAAVDILYNTMLDRAADAGGKAGWVDALNKGYTLQNIIDGFCGSPEFKAICDSFGIEPGSVGAAAPADMSTPRGKIEAFVKRCYSLILSRDADQGGLQGWSDALESGAGQACQIIDGFVRSEEYTNRNLDAGASVDILYKTMLNREPDPDGRAGWVDALGQGYTLQHIINGFCGSAEFTAICNDYGITAGTLSIASALVKREAITPEGDEAEAPVVYQGYNSEFINEEKIRAFVEHCYVAVFGREGDTEGVENYTKLILNGRKMPKKVAYEFIFSPEFQEKLPGNEEFIRILYRLYFDREPGAEELAGWVTMLENGASLEEIVNGFAGSAEFKAIVNGMK